MDYNTYIKYKLSVTWRNTHSTIKSLIGNIKFDIQQDPNYTSENVQQKDSTEIYNKQMWINEYILPILINVG